MAVLIKNWTSINATENDKLEKNEGGGYFTFTGISSTDDAALDDEDKGVQIGIYKVDEGDSVYAFASTMEGEVSGTSTITVNTQNSNATLIASGTGKLSSDKKSVENIQITLKGDNNAETFKQLGFSGENITKIEGSSGNDKIYIISDQGKNGVSKEAVLDFAQNGNDSVVFSGSTTIQSINPGGGGRKYTHPRGPDR